MKLFAERRKYPRIQTHFKVKLKLKNNKELASAFATDVSKGGIFFQTKSLLGPNDLVDIFFSFPGRRKELKVTGQIVRLVTLDDPNDDSKNLYGAGLKFIKVDRNVQKAISKFLKRL